MSKGEEISVSSTGGQKAGNNVRVGLIPGVELLEVAELYGKGAEKYDANNWMQGYEWSKSFDALNRHLWDWWNGHEFDDGEGGTGLEHMTCVIFHALALMYFRKHFPEFDDRPSTVVDRRPSQVSFSDWSMGLLKEVDTQAFYAPGKMVPYNPGELVPFSGDETKGYAYPPPAPMVLTEDLRGWKWQRQTLTGALVYWFLDGEWWCMSTENTHLEDPWALSVAGSGDVSTGPFSLYVE